MYNVTKYLSNLNYLISHKSVYKYPYEIQHKTCSSRCWRLLNFFDIHDKFKGIWPTPPPINTSISPINSAACQLSTSQVFKGSDLSSIKLNRRLKKTTFDRLVLAFD